MRKFLDECDQLSRLSHENIVCHIATLIDNTDFPVCMMELVDCSLKINLNRMWGENFHVRFCTNKEELVHRDLCADNVFLALTTDFGFSKLLCGDFSVTLSVFTKREA